MRPPHGCACGARIVARLPSLFRGCFGRVGCAGCCASRTPLRQLTSAAAACSEGGFFNAVMTFPSDYPNSPPCVRFTSEVWHPNGAPCRTAAPTRRR